MSFGKRFLSLVLALLITVAPNGNLVSAYADRETGIKLNSVGWRAEASEASPDASDSGVSDVFTADEATEIGSSDLEEDNFSEQTDYVDVETNEAANDTASDDETENSAESLTENQEPDEEKNDTDETRLEAVVESLPLDKLTGDYSADLLLIARSQLGYTESETDFVVDEDGENDGYTCYGDFCGLPYGKWCAMFISFCLHYANIPTDVFPRSLGVSTWIDALRQTGLFREAGSYNPHPGDLIFFGESVSEPIHVGILSRLYSIDTEEGSTSYAEVIEGNALDKVCTLSYELDDPTIIGYGFVPFKHTNQELEAKVYADEGKTLLLESEEMSILVSGDLPYGASVEAYPVSAELENGERVFAAFDINLLNLDGNSIQPENGSLRVKITAPALICTLPADEALGIYHFHGDEQELIDAEPDISETSIAFETSGFSVFALGSMPYAGDYIHISRYEQLLLIGSGAEVTDTDTQDGGAILGEPLIGSDGEPLRYTSDAHYYLDNDIALPDGVIWRLPDDFSGTFAGAEDADATRLYDKDSDSIYIQNRYQLAILSSEEREETPVISGDCSALSFGMGQFIFPEEDENGDCLCYSANHHYIISAAFSAERSSSRRAPRRTASQESNDALIDGRDYFGQATVEIDGTTYILIGDRQQLDAINNSSTTNRTYVYGPVFKVYQRRERLGNWNADNIIEESVEIIYPGDADLIDGIYNGNESVDFSEALMYSGNNGLLSSDAYPSLTAALDITGYDRTFYCTVDSATGTWSVDARSNSTLTYEKNGNYIVFRDIDMTVGALNGEEWRPLMFTGTMYGVKSDSPEDVGTLWDSGKTLMNINTSNKPVISNLTVRPDTLEQLGQTRLDLNRQVGVGFFGTLSGDYSSSSIIRDPVIVNNIKLRSGSVDNPTVKADIDQSAVNLLLVGLGTTLGVVLDPALKLLTGKDIGVREMLTGLLNARAKDPSSSATGAFAGRIIGDAVILNCEVEDISVTALKTSYEDDGKIVGKGGFVGYVEGETKYDTLSLLVGGVGDALSGLLNLIPGVGLGDLISVLLDNALPLKDLIPTGYSVPEIRNCKVIDATLSTEDGRYGVGGFVGSLCGTLISDCSVENSSMTVKAEYFGGGFAGIERDAIIKGTLSGLGVDIGSLHPQSELIRCSIIDSDIIITGNTYLGGFVGAMANSYGLNDRVSGGSLSVYGSGDFVGGYCGYAHLGTLFGFGSFLEDGESLLSTVKGLVTGLLGSGSDQSLLDVGGVAPSAVMGLQLEAPLTVSSEGAFVGGIVGRGNGTYITDSTQENLRKLGKYDGNNPPALPLEAGEARPNYIYNLVSVTAGSGKTDNTHRDKSFAGGLAGYLTSANVGGLLGDTAGVAQYLGFTVCDTTIRGVDDGYTVTADEDYGAGGIGWAVGGDVYDTELLRLKSVTAKNHAGGFVGATGPGDLVSGNGLDLQLLGISLIKIDNLLSLVSGVRTTYQRANVSGIDEGFTVQESGLRDASDTAEYVSGGWAAQANSVRVVDCHADKLLSVNANMHDGYSGGFVGSSSAGGLAGIVEDSANLSVAQVGQLVDAVPYLVPSYDGCSVHYVDGGYVQADMAGGFAGDFQSGKVNTYTDDDKNPISDVSYSSEHAPGYQYGTSGEAWSVYNIDHVRGGRYGGGWGGKVYSGALVSAGGGLSVLGGAASAALSASQLLGVASVYVPLIRYAGVYAPDRGFTVYAAHDYEDANASATEGYAGGFIGYGSGVQVSYSDVYKLRHGDPTEPSALTASDESAYSKFNIKPAALESQDGSSYMIFDNSPDKIPYAVAGARYAGGYIGHMDIGSAASVGDGLKLLGNSISLTNVLDVLSAVVSTIEHSDVTGCPGGFSVVASPRINLHNGSYGNAGGLGEGYAGGYAGKISGGHIQDGNVALFSYIVGEIAAGGYAGEAMPGDVASILKDGSSLSLLGEVNSLASLVEDFVPTIRNSETTCVPCGGAVRAQCFSDGAGGGSVIRGMAGGYIGHCKGAQIWGCSGDVWKNENPYSGEKRECAAIRIRSVYGAEYAGGYCGLMECGSTAQTGGLSLLDGLLSADNLIGALNAVYPTVRYGAVYGPLRQTDLTTWNAWVSYVGMNGAFYPELYRLGALSSQAELDAAIENFAYGTHVVAGRHEFDNSTNTILSGCAGGFVGSMHSGVIRNSHAEDTKLVSAMRASGGFAGEMQTKGAAEFGTANILGILPLNVGNIVSLADVFVPAVSASGTNGYQKGLTVQATGERNTAGVGCAGGYVGGCYGGQLGRKNGDTLERVWAHGLKAVHGTYCIGGFIGKSSAASVLDANTNDASSGLLQNLLNRLVSTPSSLLSLLQATVSTVKYAELTSSDEAWGIVVDGEYKNNGVTDWADYAGGFAGSLEATVLGERRNDADTLTVSKLRSVNGGYYSGGFFGLADVTSVANVGTGSGTSVLSLVNLGNTSLLDAFRTYIYHATVTGVDDGITVLAHKESSMGTMNQYQVSGGAGGFGGGLMNGTVENSQVTNVNYVEAPNYAAGFIAQMGKSGILDLSQLQITDESFLGKLLDYLGIDPNVGAQLLSIVGATVKNCRASGFGHGFIAKTTMIQSSGHNNNENEAFLTGSCAAGFTGFADIAQIDGCHVSGFKYASSPQIAAGFIGRSSAAYLAEIDVDLTLLNALLTVLSPLIGALYGLTTVDLIDLGDAGNRIGLKVISDGNLVYLNLFGLEVGVSLMQNDPEYEGSSDSLTVTLGSSTIKLPYNPTDGYNSSAPNASVNLIEGNRTSVKNCTVTGVESGYDVFGGGSDQNADGSGSFGYAGGFVGYNDMGYFSHDRMWLCDVVRGTAGRVGPFAGDTKPGTRSQDYLEGNDNWYSVYRSESTAYTEAQTASGAKIADAVSDTSTSRAYKRYDLLHYSLIKEHGDLKDAVEANADESIALDAYASAAKAVLMLDTPPGTDVESEAVAPGELKDPCAEFFELRVEKIWRDFNNIFNSRPDGIEIEVAQIDVGTQPRAQLIQSIFPESDWKLLDTFTVTLYPPEDPNTVHWSGTLGDLPVAKEIDGEVHYLQYVVTEKAVDNYKVTQYELLEDTATVIITNSFDGLPLPQLGGSGNGERLTVLFVMMGALLLMCGIYLIPNRKGKRRRGVRA